MKLWLDDVRKPPDNSWHWVRTAEEAISWLADGIVSEASLDHDLGYSASRMSGYDVVCYLERVPDNLPWNGTKVHSMNPVGAEKMRVVLNKLYTKEPS